MDNPFEYPDNRSEFYEGPSEEEAHFYFTLMDFKGLVKAHGAAFVMNRLDQETFDSLVDWFMEDEDE